MRRLHVSGQGGLNTGYPQDVHAFSKAAHELLEKVKETGTRRKLGGHSKGERGGGGRMMSVFSCRPSRASVECAAQKMG